MTNIRNILQQLSGEGMVKALEARMVEQLPDFAQARKRYADAMAVLEHDLGTAAVKTEAEAIVCQMGSLLLFCGALGFKANLDHFLDPVSKNFLDVDPETYLREPLVQSLPEFRQAAEAHALFVASLSQEQQILYEDVAEYAAYLKTVGPKLAHFWGYMLANEFLPKIIPGYYSDTNQIRAYRAKLIEFFGCEGDGLLLG